MGSDWITLSLGEISQNISRPFQFNDFDEVCFINTGDVLEGKFLHSKKVSKNGLPGQAKKRIEYGDILYSEIRPKNMRFAKVNFDPKGYVVSTKFMVLKITTEAVDYDFFYILVTCNSTLNEFQRIAESRSGTFPQITFDAVSYYKFSIPPLPEQKAIAHILGTLDDKIELNRQMNETLEAMAQALFKSWFVDFDPVLDNAIIAGNAIPNAFAERATIRKQVFAENNQANPCAENFPSEFEFTDELGWIPKGWHVDYISETCEKIQSGGTPKRSNDEFWNNGSIPWLTSGEVRQTIISKVENNISELGLSNSSAKWLKEGSTLIAMYGATAGQVAFSGIKTTTNQAVCGLIPKKNCQYFNYLCMSLSVSYFENRATGSAQQNINKGIIENTKVVLPNRFHLENFERQCSGIFQKCIHNQNSINSISKLRDTLLPQLLSGKLRIADAEKMVAELS